ncbi:MAG: hypothetical protein ACLTDR_00005, partial [Adlercreutzia equolifaciens]
MADDGGRTGILREEADVTPPGDVRKCHRGHGGGSRTTRLTRALEVPLRRCSQPYAGQPHAGSRSRMRRGRFPRPSPSARSWWMRQRHVYPSTRPWCCRPRPRTAHSDGQAVAAIPRGVEPCVPVTRLTLAHVTEREVQ